MKKLFAFWNYSFGIHTGFKGMLGAEITKIHENGRISAVGYPGYSFKPVKILPEKAGAKLARDIETLRKEYEGKIKDVIKDYEKRFKELVDTEH